jgi:hypothetical protein
MTSIRARNRLRAGLVLTALATGLATVLSGCATVAPGAGWTGLAPATPAVNGATFGPAQATPSTSPSATTATPSPSATPSASQTPAAPVDPLAGVSKKTLAEFKPCLKKTVAPYSSGYCARLVVKKLKAAGFFPWKSVGTINVTAANAILNYQRSRGLKADAIVRKATWIALATKAPSVPKVLPEKCKGKGVWLCVDQAHRTLSWVKNGKVVKTFKVRLGGWAYLKKKDAKQGKWKVYATANGTWKVYNKLVDPPSENYGSGAMPYSTIFYPDMYVHYSPGFHSVGYRQSSHGCVNIGKLSEAIWIFKNTPIGAKVFIYSPKTA